MTQKAARPNMPKAYDPQAVEQRIYDRWERDGYFTPRIDPSIKPFVIMMPLPNVTGELHVGHALMVALQDLMVRWHRMRGEPTLYLPGTDHAGIATHVVVERELAKEGLSRYDLGREKFEERVVEWVSRNGERIYVQIRRLGASCDWSRKTYTLDEGPSRAVRQNFVNLYRKGLIYRGERITNWCPRCATALSDLEVKHEDESGNLYYVRYPLEDGSGAVTIATTRPETMLADTAVAVNPEDERYTDVVGKNVVLPVLKRVIPVISDEAVDSEFGTGALKITPGHDPTDFEIGERRGLPTINVMDLDGTMNENAGDYQGQGRFECRKNIVEELERDGLLEKIEPYHHSVGHCDRCNEVVEPIVTKQWYVDMKPLAKPARDAVADGRIKFVPERFSRVYLNWIDNIRDWCISRQIWWGHRVPVWYCEDCDEVVVELEDLVSCAACGSLRVRQDPDVLDTWFSSALWPHSTLGWPDITEDLDYFYPGSVLETGYDILFLWVARMVMIGLENLGDVPFDTVYIHGLVRDPEGVKMSKMRGNVLDPLELIDIYGADALRFALTTGNSPGNDMRLSEGKLEASRNYCNKLWNAARYVMTTLGPDGAVRIGETAPAASHRHDRWILSRLTRATEEAQRYMEDFQFGEAQRVLHDFLWSEYCDWYIEMAKVRIRAGNESGPSPVPVLVYVLERVLRLLHPFLPFITEEIWQTLKGLMSDPDDMPPALIVASYPDPDGSLLDVQAEEEVGTVIEIVRAVRNLRAEFRIQPTMQLEAIVHAPEIAHVVRAEAAAIQSLARVAPLTVAEEARAASADEVALVLSRGTVTVPVGGVVDLDRERERLQSELGEHDGNIRRVNARLKDTRFVERAPDEVVERERERLRSLQARRARLSEVLSRLRGA